MYLIMWYTKQIIQMEKIHTSNIPAIVYPMDIGVIGKFSIVALMEMFLEQLNLSICFKIISCGGICVMVS